MRKHLAGTSALGTVLALLLATMCIGGCGDSRSEPHGPTSALAPRSFIAKVEHQCGVVYTKLKIRGKALGFTCGKTANGAHFGATFTRRPRCTPFITVVVNAGEDRTQGCATSTTARPTGTITCESNNTLTVAARTLPGIRSATVRLSTGQEATSGILSLNAVDRERWGGVYFNVLTSRMPPRAVLIERDQAGRTLHRLSLIPVGMCPVTR